MERKATIEILRELYQKKRALEDEINRYKEKHDWELLQEDLGLEFPVGSG